MLPFLTEFQANPSSPHSSGQAVRSALEGAREQTAAALGASADGVVFTAGGTEADNLAIFGIMAARKHRGDGFITSAVEHHAVLRAAEALARGGARVTVLPVDDKGRVDPDALASAIDDRTVLVSIMHANNELGTIQPIAKLAEIAHERGALFHTDAVQSAGHIPVGLDTLGADALSIAAHKFEGPKGVGALALRAGLSIAPQMHGGEQEHRLRAGTENVAAIVGLAVALDLAAREAPIVGPRVAALRERFESEMLARINDSCVNGAGAQRLPGIASIRFAGTDAAALILAADVEGIDVSTGSACTSGSLEPSHVLTAIGLSPADARGTVRFSFGRTTDDEEIGALIRTIPGIIRKMRAIAGTLATG